jgi:hypothetical protein
MGREATCKCEWAGTTASVKALLETSELILRGEIRKRVPFTELKSVKAGSDRLSFRVGADPVHLYLGAAQAQKWAAALKAGPTPLAKKLGITAKTQVRTVGAMSDDALASALAEAGQVSARTSAKIPDVIVACIDTPESLSTALGKTEAQLAKGVPIWLVYPKGPGRPLNESLVRAELLPRGMVDTKVAAVSATLTAIRFNLRRVT